MERDCVYRPSSGFYRHLRDRRADGCQRRELDRSLPVRYAQRRGQRKNKKTNQVTKDRTNKGMVTRVEFIKKEDAARTIMCTIAQSTFNAIVSGEDASGWSQGKYGVPCYEEKLSFGKTDHRFVVATDGAYFKSAKRSYGEWVKTTTSESRSSRAFQKCPPCRSYFPYWGTYAYENWENKNKLKSFVVYSPQEKKAYAIEGVMAERYVSPDRVLNTYLPALLGFPTSAIADTAVSSFEINGAVYGSGGKYQQFANGTLYSKDRWWPVPDSVYPVVGTINKRHNDLGEPVRSDCRRWIRSLSATRKTRFFRHLRAGQNSPQTWETTLSQSWTAPKQSR